MVTKYINIYELENDLNFINFMHPIKIQNNICEEFKNKLFLFIIIQKKILNSI